VGVEGRDRIVRVQVKSTIYKRRNGEYSLNIMGPKRKKYAPGTVDFFAILLIPIDDWYIIPFEVMGRKNSSIHFTPGSKRQKCGLYQEAWELLLGVGFGSRRARVSAPHAKADSSRCARNDKTLV
jgi:hypothetical protein